MSRRRLDSVPRDGSHAHLLIPDRLSLAGDLHAVHARVHVAVPASEHRVVLLEVIHLGVGWCLTRQSALQQLMSIISGVFYSYQVTVSDWRNLIGEWLKRVIRYYIAI